MPLELPDVDPCPFCENFAGRYSETSGRPAILFETDDCFSYLNPAPLGGMPGHALVLPRRHVATLFDLTRAEEAALAHLTADTARALRNALNPDGLLVVQRNGVVAEQTVRHVHFHVIPRREQTVWPPTEWVPNMPNEERQSLAAEIRDFWPT